MNSTWLTDAAEVGTLLGDAFLLPGEALMPAMISVLGNVFGGHEMLFSLLLSTVSWILVLILVLKLVGLTCRVAVRAWAPVAVRISNIRTMLACRKKSHALHKQREPRAQAEASEADVEVHFDNLDLLVLNSAATLGPAHALTAPDLAEEFNLRSPQVQRSLEKLATNMMLDHAFGATDGYQNYRLSRAGTAFLSMWKRKRN